MLVEEMIELLKTCNPKAKMEVRGVVDGEYIDEEVDGVNDCDDLVVIDI